MVAVIGLAACLSQAKSASHSPQWVRVAVAKEIATFRKVFEANPEHVWYIEYPAKVAVTVQFDRPVRLPIGGPGGRAMRFSFDRVTHRQNPEIRWCEVVGDSPPIARCFSR